MRFRERLARFMQGRYGMDQLNRTLLIAALVSSFLSIFVLRPVFYVLSLLLIIICYIRMVSRNINARYNENMAYLKQADKVKYLFGKAKYRVETSKTHHIYTCPKCKQKIRIPRGKGKIMVRCPKCGTEFMKKS